MSSEEPEAVIQRRPGTDQRGLSANRRKRRPPAYRDTTDVADCARRLILAVGKRVAQEDPEDLKLLARLGETVEEALAVAVAGQRRGGITDGQIGDALGGVTKQAIQQRFPRDAS